MHTNTDEAETHEDEAETLEEEAENVGREGGNAGIIECWELCCGLICCIIGLFCCLIITNYILNVIFD
jgi:hypothetical protein